MIKKYDGGGMGNSSKIRVAILTGSEPRHTFMRKAIALDDRFDVVISLCEGLTQSLASRFAVSEHEQIKAHISQRERSELDFFDSFCQMTPDLSSPFFISKGAVNDESLIQRVADTKPDVIVCFGCSLLKDGWLTQFGGRILNMHLGLSPYYRGSGTNFWAMVNEDFDLVGATFMLLDEGIDTGPILHQVRARVFSQDDPHTIGHRLILDAVAEFCEVIESFDGTIPESPFSSDFKSKIYFRKDFTVRSVEQLYLVFKNGGLERYIRSGFQPRRIIQDNKVRRSEKL